MHSMSKSYGERKWPDVPVMKVGPRLRLGVEATPLQQAIELYRLREFFENRATRLQDRGRYDEAGALLERVERIDADLRLLGLVHDVDLDAAKSQAQLGVRWDCVTSYEREV